MSNVELGVKESKINKTYPEEDIVFFENNSNPVNIELQVETNTNTTNAPSVITPLDLSSPSLSSAPPPPLLPRNLTQVPPKICLIPYLQ